MLVHFQKEQEGSIYDPFEPVCCFWLICEKCSPCSLSSVSRILVWMCIVAMLKHGTPNN